MKLKRKLKSYESRPAESLLAVDRAEEIRSLVSVCNLEDIIVLYRNEAVAEPVLHPRTRLRAWPENIATRIRAITCGIPGSIDPASRAKKSYIQRARRLRDHNARKRPGRFRWMRPMPSFRLYLSPPPFLACRDFSSKRPRSSATAGADRALTPQRYVPRRRCHSAARCNRSPWS